MGSRRWCWFDQKATAAGIMTFFVFLGGWTVGRNVMNTLTEGIITIEISLAAGIAILFSSDLASSSPTFSGVPVPTSL